MYFGYQKHWDEPVSLLEKLEVPEEFKPFVNDYRINLFEIAYLTREQVNLFKSDFRIVADYFVQKRESGDYVPEPVEIIHVQETLQLLSVMSGDYRFEEVYNEMVQENAEREACKMCDVLDRIENRGIQQGVQQGIQQGIQQGENAFAKLMQILFAQGRMEDARRAAEDREYRHVLMKEFAISK